MCIPYCIEQYNNIQNNNPHRRRHHRHETIVIRMLTNNNSSKYVIDLQHRNWQFGLLFEFVNICINIWTRINTEYGILVSSFILLHIYIVSIPFSFSTRSFCPSSIPIGCKFIHSLTRSYAWPMSIARVCDCAFIFRVVAPVKQFVRTILLVSWTFSSPFLY